MRRAAGDGARSGRLDDLSGAPSARLRRTRKRAMVWERDLPGRRCGSFGPSPCAWWRAHSPGSWSVAETPIATGQGRKWLTGCAGGGANRGATRSGGARHERTAAKAPGALRSRAEYCRFSL